MSSPEIPATPATPAPALAAQQKDMLLMAVSQLDQLVLAFGDAPEPVKSSAAAFKQALQDWADGKL